MSTETKTLTLGTKIEFLRDAASRLNELGYAFDFGIDLSLKCFQQNHTMQMTWDQPDSYQWTCHLGQTQTGHAREALVAVALVDYDGRKKALQQLVDEILNYCRSHYVKPTRPTLYQCKHCKVKLSKDLFPAVDPRMENPGTDAQCHHCGAFVYPVVAPWDNDQLQFARLLCELEAVGVFTPEVMSVLRDSMDLTDEQIAEIQERANICFEQAKREMMR